MLTSRKIGSVFLFLFLFLFLLQFACCLVCLFVCFCSLLIYLFIYMFGCLVVCSLPIYLFVYMVGWLVGRMDGWLVGWLVGWVFGWLFIFIYLFWYFFCRSWPSMLKMAPAWKFSDFLNSLYEQGLLFYLFYVLVDFWRVLFLHFLELASVNKLKHSFFFFPSFFSTCWWKVQFREPKSMAMICLFVLMVKLTIRSCNKLTSRGNKINN